MYANVDADDDTAAESLQVSALMGGAPLTLSNTPPQGTVAARIASDDRHFYGRMSETLICGSPLGITRKPRPRVSARDLVEELHSINTQIHRIMFQVEKAVSRLATSG
jgi:hypothetical protein